MTTNNRSRFNLSIDAKLLEDLKVQAIYLGVDTSNFIQMIITRGLAVGLYEEDNSNQALQDKISEVQDKYFS